MDSTSRPAPNIMLQVYAIHVNMREQLFPVVIVLQSYEYMFQILKDEV